MFRLWLEAREVVIETGSSFQALRSWLTAFTTRSLMIEVSFRSPARPQALAALILICK